MADDAASSTKAALRSLPGNPSPAKTVRPLWIAITCVFAMILAWAYWPTFITVCNAWLSDPDYTHGFFVIPISLWLLWLRREHAPMATMRIDPRGLLLLLLAGAIRCFAGRFYILQLDAWSIPIWVAGVVWTLFGWQLLRWALPAIAFLWFATPLPGTIEIILSTPLQRLAASTSAWVLRLIGQPALVQGTTILLDDKPLDVERACSGLRMFYGIFALAVACIALSRPERWKAVLVMFAAAPVAIIANVFRIVITAILMKFASNENAQKFSHDLAGIVMIPLAVTMFLVFLVLLGRVVERMRDPRGVAWLIRWCVAGVVLIGVLLLWGRHQDARALSTYLDTAARYESEKDWSNTVKYLTLYVNSAPDDHDTFTRLARTYAEHSGGYQEYLRAVDLLQTAWKNQPEHEDLGVLAVQIAMQIGDFDDAIPIADRLAKTKDPKTRGDSVKLRAKVLNAYLRSDKNRGDYNWNHVKDALEDELKLPDYDVVDAIQLADVYRNPRTNIKNDQREKLASGLLDRVVKERAADPMAWLGRFALRTSSGKSADHVTAATDLDRAIKLAKEQPQNRFSGEVLTKAAAYKAANKETNTAVELLQKAIEIAPTEPVPYLLLADIKAQNPTKESTDQSIKILRQGIDRIGKNSISQTVLLRLRYASLIAEKGDLAEAESTIGPVENLMTRLNGRDKSSLKLDVGIVRSQILLGRDGPQAAANQLSDLLDDTDIQLIGQLKPEVMAKAYAYLAQLYSSLGLGDLAADSMHQAARFQPSNPDWQVQAAVFTQQAGDLDSADRQYQATQKAYNSADIQLARIEIEIKRLVQNGATKSDWDRVTETLKEASKAGASPVAVRLLYSEILASSEDRTKAEQVLTKLTEDWPKDPSGWRALALVRLQAGEVVGSLKAADNFAAIANQPVEAASLRAGILAGSGKTDDAVKELTAAVEKAQPKDASKATIALSQLLSQLGKTDQARAALEKAHEKDSKNLQVVEMLATTAFLLQDWKALEKYESWLKTIEGEPGTIWRAFRAQRMLASARSVEDKDFQEAIAQVDDILRKRPHWSKAHFLQGEIEYRLNRADTATAAYERAWQYGGRGILLTDRLIDLFTRQGRYTDARQIVAQAHDYLAVSQGLFDRAIPYLAEGEQTEKDKMEPMARLWVKQNPNDPEAHLRLGRVLLLQARLESKDRKQKYKDEAKTEFRRAIELSPNDARPWASIVMLYDLYGEPPAPGAKAAQSPDAPDDAQQFAEEFARQENINELERVFVLAQLYERRQQPQALSYYSRAISLVEKNPKQSGAARVLGRAARFYLPTVASLAEIHARRALKLDPANTDAQLVLLNLCANRTDPRSAAEGLKLLDDNKTKGLVDPAIEVRYRAAFLSRRANPGDMDAAIDVLRRLTSPAREDKLLLARLYEQSRQMPPALDLLQQLVRAPNPNATELIEFLRFWQEHFVANTVGKALPQFAGQARDVYQRLGELPNQLPERLRWQLRELKARKNPAPAAGDPCTPIVSEVLASPAAQKLNERERKQLYQVVLVVLLQEQREECAVQFATEPHEGASAAELAICLCHAYVAVPQTKENAPFRQQAIDRLLATQSQNADVVQAIGDSAFMAADYGRAADAYQQVIQLKPNENMPRNNRALALIELGRSAEAREVLAVALKATPENPDLLDTQAIIDIQDHHPENALPVLKKLVSQIPANAILQFHLAAAYNDAKDTSRAREALLAATALGIDQHLLSPRDNKTLANLKALYLAPATVVDRASANDSQARN